MTKKEFNYWKENIDKIINADYISIYLYNSIIVNDGFVVSMNENTNTPNPDIKYFNYEKLYFTTANKKITNVIFDNDELIITTKIKHFYIDKDNKTKNKCLLSKLLVNKFKRSNIRNIDVGHFYKCLL